LGFYSLIFFQSHLRYFHFSYVQHFCSTLNPARCEAGRYFAGLLFTRCHNHVLRTRAAESKQYVALLLSFYFFAPPPPFFAAPPSSSSSSSSSSASSSSSSLIFSFSPSSSSFSSFLLLLRFKNSFEILSSSIYSSGKDLSFWKEVLIGSHPSTHVLLVAPPIYLEEYPFSFFVCLGVCMIFFDVV
jgi:hypothetical protein